MEKSIMPVTNGSAENHKISKILISLMILFSLANIKRRNPSVQKYEVHVVKIKYTFIPAAKRPPVAYLTKEVNSRLVKGPLIFNGSLLNRGLTSLIKEATGFQRVQCCQDQMPN